MEKFLYGFSINYKKSKNKNYSGNALNKLKKSCDRIYYKWEKS